MIPSALFAAGSGSGFEVGSEPNAVSPADVPSVAAWSDSTCAAVGSAVGACVAGEVSTAPTGVTVGTGSTGAVSCLLQPETIETSNTHPTIRGKVHRFTGSFSIS